MNISEEIFIAGRKLSHHRIHLIGVGGTGMSGLAFYLLECGVPLSGSDATHSPVIKQLEQLGLNCFIGHRKENIQENTTLVIRSAAIKEDNVEIQRAIELNIPILKYAEALGIISKERKTIAISGCHGKTTTSSMIAYLLHHCALKPSFVVGGIMKNFSKNAAKGDGDFFVLEACEYDRSFLNYSPFIAVITNIDSDHLDFYGSFENLLNAYEEFTQKIHKDGTLIYNADDKYSSIIAEKLPIRKLSYGLNKNCFCYPKNIEQSQSETIFETIIDGSTKGIVHLRTPGIHNVLNALASLCVAYILKIPFEKSSEALSNFSGVRRRLDIVFLNDEKILIDDYGHHPVEIDAVVRTLRTTYKEKPITLIFQPHQSTRTRIFMDEFVNVLKQCDLCIITPIFRAREQESSDNYLEKTMIEKINSAGGNAIFMPSFQGVSDFFSENRVNGVIVTQGAGDIFKLSQMLREKFFSSMHSRII